MMEVPTILLNRLLEEAAKKKASSLHLIAGNIPTMRINNQLVVIEGENILDADTLKMIINSFVTPEEAERLAVDKEITLAKNFAGTFRFRINVFYQKNLPSMTFCYVPEVVNGIEQLKLPQIFTDLTKIPSGLFILAGSHASGKTTSAAAVIEEINNQQKKHIITIEDPIEYSFVSKKSIIEQRQIGSDTQSYVTGLNYCLEEDVDLVYVGEIRKELQKCMGLILELATGNSLVIMEVNANNTTRAIEKVLTAAEFEISDEAARYSLADSLIGVVVQRLLPRRGGGMVAAHEILLTNSAVKSLIREGKIYQLESIIQTSRKEGMMMMEKSLEELVRNNDVRQEDI